MSYSSIPLPRERYNFSQRNLAAQEMSQAFMEMKFPVVESDINYEFYIDSFVYNHIKALEPFPEQRAILNALRIFCSNSKYSRFFCGFLEITIRSKSNLNASNKIIVSEVSINSVLFHNLIVDITKLPLVCYDIRNNITREVDLIPSRETGGDGQMKIMVDAVLAVDSLIEQESVKICVIGSSHEITTQPRYAYAPIMQMVQQSEIHMYDFVEEQGVTREGSNIVTRNSSGADYSQLKQYDLVIDDVWANGKTSLMSDYMLDKTIDLVYPDNFSIKSFGERSEEGNVYKQCGFTLVGEQRVVSRPVIPSYKNRQYLGSCIFCRELKYFLRREYDLHFYKAVMLSHKKPCYVPGLDRLVDFVSSKHDLVTNLDWREILVRRYHSDTEIQMRLRSCKKHNKIIDIVDVDMEKIRQHPNDVLDFDVVELRAEILTLVDIVVSNNIYVTRLLFESARNIYKIDARSFYMLIRPVRGVAVTTSMADFSQALSHRGYWT